MLKLFLVSGLLASLGLSSAALADRETQAARFYEDALVRYGRNDVQGTIVQSKNALQQDLRLVSAHILIGQAYLKAGQRHAAERALLDAERLGVDRTETALPMAEALFDQGKHRAVLDRGMAEGLAAESRARLLTLRGRAFMELLDYESADKALTEAEATDPGAVAVVVARATLALNSGQLDAARQLAERVVARAPNDAAASNILASIHHVQGGASTKRGRVSRARCSSSPTFRRAHRPRLAQPRHRRRQGGGLRSGRHAKGQDYRPAGVLPARDVVRPPGQRQTGARIPVLHPA